MAGAWGSASKTELSQKRDKKNNKYQLFNQLKKSLYVLNIQSIGLIKLKYFLKERCFQNLSLPPFMNKSADRSDSK